jgi:hypothetical protein
MTDSNKSISPLRQRMIEDMTLRKLSPKTQATYLRAVLRFTHFFGQSPDLASPEDLRAFQLHLVEASGIDELGIHVHPKGRVDNDFQSNAGRPMDSWLHQAPISAPWPRNSSCAGRQHGW